MLKDFSQNLVVNKLILTRADTEIIDEKYRDEDVGEMSQT